MHTDAAAFIPKAKKEEAERKAKYEFQEIDKNLNTALINLGEAEKAKEDAEKKFIDAKAKEDTNKSEANINARKEAEKKLNDAVKNVNEQLEKVNEEKKKSISDEAIKNTIERINAINKIFTDTNINEIKNYVLNASIILQNKYTKRFIEIPQPSNLDNVKSLCGKCFDFIFNKADHDQKNIVVDAFSSIMNYIYYYFDITTPVIDIEDVKKIDLNNIDSHDKISSNFVLSVNDYYEVLMMLFPYIVDWNKLKDVENLEDLFKTDKYNKFVINNQNIK